MTDKLGELADAIAGCRANEAGADDALAMVAYGLSDSEFDDAARRLRGQVPEHDDILSRLCAGTEPECEHLEFAGVKHLTGAECDLCGGYYAAALKKWVYPPILKSIYAAARKRREERR